MMLSLSKILGVAVGIQWFTFVILATQRRQRSGGLWFKASPGMYLEKTLHKKGWWSVSR
jgi:hypothetical protein